MKKIWLIFKREYLTRVQKRSFLLVTLLAPISIVVFIGLVSFIMQYQGSEDARIAVMDEAGILGGKGIPSAMSGKIHFTIIDDDLTTAKSKVSEGEYNGLLVIPPITNLKAKRQQLDYYADNQLSLDESFTIGEVLSDRIRNYKIQAFQLDQRELEYLETSVHIDPKPLTDEAEDVSAITSVISAAIGGTMGVLMYFVLFVYGMMVMRSVMEEKTTRIVEVMISTVKPFQLMLGKILGVGAVGLTQLAIWAVLLPLVYLLAGAVFGIDTSGFDSASSVDMADIDPDDLEAMATLVMYEFNRVNWWMVLPLFLFFFITGYVLYASLFAAVGSAVGDDLNDSQALVLPITIPVIIAFYIMFAAVRSPESNLAVWSSIFPLFAPIVMPARLAFNPPAWQIILSVLLTFGCTLLFVWLAGRIYRVGILMYGKKGTLKEIVKWMFYR